MGRLARCYHQMLRFRAASSSLFLLCSHIRRRKGGRDRERKASASSLAEILHGLRHCSDDIPEEGEAGLGDHARLGGSKSCRRTL